MVLPKEKSADTKYSTLIMALATAGLFTALIIRQYLFINRYAINLMIWDQWSIYAPLFDGDSLWGAFDFQHGPHRQGVGAIVMCGLAKIGNWNSRWDAFAVGITLTVAAATAILLAWKCGVKWVHLWIIPLLVLNIRQYEGFVHASNVSHGAMPVFLLMILSLCWYIQSPVKRLACVSLLTFALIFTGFGLFAGLLTPLILLVESRRHFSRKEYGMGWRGVGAIASIACFWLLFLHNYHFAPAVAEYRFPYEKPWEYLYFISSMLSNFGGLAGYGVLSLIVGFGIACFLVFISVINGLNILRGSDDARRSTVIFCLSAFTLIFCIETAVGRVFLGWEAASRASRYVTLMIPGWLAIGLHLSTLKSIKAAHWSVLGFGLLLMWGTLFLKPSDWELITRWSTGRKLWKDTYLTTHDVQKADEVSQFSIYPGPAPEGRLNYLEKHHLNLFNGDTVP
jgi:hypothetical protein